MPQNEALIHKYSEMFRFVQTTLLADAEMCENVAENFVWGNMSAEYFGEMGDAEAEVFGYEITG